ncbi:SDR family NAD(P)-dependent oxidoreductase [Cyclobacterium jeungdonense]|uniref:Glucose 1-dehydrogenase n=1 Tax=Cyclobacterium jeungdonense TaxID=708087 RepID=A0ABT8CC36_9BACT|nr:glucose 1-dehydrogenase [Cyclobacterium jeungdonense]MDN3690383.1 glucose 1-dehydrogenase [Cyclobacterium jeungdonense]
MDLSTLFSLQNKVAIITGASRGIGFSIAHFFAAAGAKVVINSRNQERLDEATRRLREKGYEVVGIANNIGYPEGRQNLINQTVEKYGQIDILVNNAATNPVFGPIEETDLSLFDKILDVNLKAPFELSKLSLPFLRQSSSASIINVSSIAGLSPEKGLGLYSVSKSALISLTKSFAKEWGTYNIRVNAICPGLIKTKFSEVLWSDEVIKEKFLSQLPLKRIGEEEEIGAMALFLASPASSYTTGSVFTVDGGFNA